MNEASKAALHIPLPDADLRWELKQAALNQRTTVRDLVVRMIREGLAREAQSRNLNREIVAR